MNGVALRILEKVAERGELSLADAVRLAKSQHGNHLDQYPLALLLEEGYLGQTLNHTPPKGAKNMREFDLAIALYMWTLPKDAQGHRKYLDIKSQGSIDPNDERIFIKAKGALYLDEKRQKRRDRLLQFLIGFVTASLVALLTLWLKGEITQQSEI